MKTLLVLLVCAAGIFAAHDAVIPAGSTIYVDSQNGFDKFLADALAAQHVPLKVISSKEQADFIFDSVVMPTWDVVESRHTGGQVGSKSEAAVKLTSKSGEIVWRLTVSEGTLKHGDKAVAMECVKHMKELVRNK